MGSRINWIVLREISAGIRRALVDTVLGWLRRGPYALHVSGPQGSAVAEEYLITGFLGRSLKGSVGFGGVSAVYTSVPGFPYVEGPPGVFFSLSLESVHVDGLVDS